MRCLALVVAVFVFCPPASAEQFDCLVAPRQVADLAFGTNGLVDRLLVDRGNSARKGDILAYLDSSVETANVAIAKERLTEIAALETARAQLVAAESKYHRTQTLESKQIMATSKLEEAEAEYKSAMLKVVEQEEAQRLKVLDLHRAEAILALRRIVSPFDGYIVERHVSPGEYVENRKALTIAELDPVYADVILPSNWFAHVKAGQPVKVLLQQPEGLTIDAQTAVIDPYVDGASGTFRVRLVMTNPGLKIVPGFRCRAEFVR